MGNDLTNEIDQSTAAVECFHCSNEATQEKVVRLKSGRQAGQEAYLKVCSEHAVPEAAKKARHVNQARPAATFARVLRRGRAQSTPDRA